ncbi:hypothetical protein K443DRAFT_679958 [Laccaria amethystina LaAM-08-1]|uniref:DUF6534 domain-containing protein n=1 Tax=Laccaria amethystina LaAM-08-1 TaxID=1095629 RepID=A0A0C9XU63_9AGAR|nr:hypothetical protein K443DRAFT_679958 [Laccaria amethystina LaAM-08-1]
MRETYVWVAIYTVLAKLYSNSFLSALNGRQSSIDSRNHPSLTNVDSDISSLVVTTHLFASSSVQIK